MLAFDDKDELQLFLAEVGAVVSRDKKKMEGKASMVGLMKATVKIKKKHE